VRSGHRLPNPDAGALTGYMTGKANNRLWLSPTKQDAKAAFAAKQYLLRALIADEHLDGAGWLPPWPGPQARRPMAGPTADHSGGTAAADSR
jgi:hypothetical protein